MKLRNIIIALSAVVAFAACSKDDNNDSYRNAPAKLTVKVLTKGTATKADPHELTGEANINTLIALVFNPDDGTKIGELSAAPNVSHEYTMAGIPAMELGIAKVILIANAPATVANVYTYAELENLLADLAVQQQNSLTMSSPVITTGPLLEGLNNIGDVTLTRLPARIQVGSVATNFTKPLLVGRRVQINSLSIENAKTKSHYFSVADWGKVNVAGNFTTTPAASFSQFTPIENMGYASYVMENLGEEDGKTTVVVRATLEASGELPALTGTFRAVVNANGKARGADHNYVKRNYVYALDFTFTDTSFNPEEPPQPEPTEGTLDVKVTVVGWGVVDQDPIIGEE